MKLIIRKTSAEMSEAAAQILLGTMYQDKRVNLSITSGASPVGTYEIMSRIIRDNPADFRNVHYYNFDNMDMEGTNGGLTMRELRRQYFDPAEVPEAQVHILTAENHVAFNTALENSGGLDLMLIGLGADGHFCGNIPGSTVFDCTTYTVAFRSMFSDNEWVKSMYGTTEIPEYAVTMGAAALMKAKRLVLIVNGKSKAETVKRFMESPVDEMFPSSVLKLHPNFTVILDADAASLL